MSERAMTILLVEDNPDHAELVRRSLAAHSLPSRIHHVEDGEAALEYLLHRGAYAPPNAPDLPDVILLDLRLPRMDGLSVLAAIKADPGLRSVPVVVLTTSAAERDMVRAYESYANSYLVKPSDFGRFGLLMNDLGYYWLGWNRRPGNAREPEAAPPPGRPGIAREPEAAPPPGRPGEDPHE
jgi:CheY-like chemotaxis protein